MSEIRDDIDERTRGDAEIELLSFHIGEQEYSVDIMSVREIRGWTRATSLPHSPPYMRGVINLRGTVLPVMDLALRLGMEAGEPEERHVIIVVDMDGRVAGMRVDAVSDILTLRRDALQPAPEVASESADGFVRALTVVEERMVRVLNLDSVLPSARELAA